MSLYLSKIKWLLNWIELNFYFHLFVRHNQLVSAVRLIGNRCISPTFDLFSVQWTTTEFSPKNNWNSEEFRMICSEKIARCKRPIAWRYFPTSLVWGKECKYTLLRSAHYCLASTTVIRSSSVSHIPFPDDSVFILLMWVYSYPDCSATLCKCCNKQKYMIIYSTHWLHHYQKEKKLTNTTTVHHFFPKCTYTQ